MTRYLTVLLLALATTNVAYGDLLRACECGPDNPFSCGSCPASRATQDNARPPC